MGIIINIDEALKNRSKYNILREPLNKMLADEHEAWEKENPIDFLYNRGTLDTFQRTFVSNIGFAHAFSETGDYAVGEIFNTAEGFSATFTSRTFQGGFIITQQTLEDEDMATASDTSKQFIRRWHGDVVEYCMKALEGGATVSGGVQNVAEWGDANHGGVSRIRLTSADTKDGDITSTEKCPLFYDQHTIVKRADMPASYVADNYQSNKFYANIDISAQTGGRISQLADIINQVITIMENYKDDNGKYAGVNGAKTIVCANDPHLKAALMNAVSAENFKQGNAMVLNDAFQRAEVKCTPYLNDCALTKDGVGFFIVDKAYNAANHGLELTERIPLTLDVIETKRPNGVTYDARERFDVNVASWRGIAYVLIKADSSGSGSLTDITSNHFTTLTPLAVDPILTKEVTA